MKNWTIIEVGLASFAFFYVLGTVIMAVTR